MITLLAIGTFLIAFWTMIPQIIAIKKYQDNPKALEGVSLLSLAIIIIDYIAWSIYGIMVNAWAIWIPSVVGIALTIITVYMLIKVISQGQRINQ